MPDVRARDSGVFPMESMRLKFRGMDFDLDSSESEMKQECINPSKNPNSPS
jgi:hypothetical protein